MARKLEAQGLLAEGLMPSEIASRMGISVASVIQYLQTRVGEGALRFSEIYFSWPPEKRRLLEDTAQENKASAKLSTRQLRELGLAAEDLDFYRSIRRRHVFAGDLYEHVAEAEIALHDMVFSVLEKEFGSADSGYWRKGIPVGIRKRCHDRREDDEDPVDPPFKYTTLIELAEIISKSWSLFQPVLPEQYSINRSSLTRDLARLNQIRNAVMHPVKRREWSEDDFEFARRLRRSFERHRAT